MVYTAQVHVAASKADVPSHLNPVIVDICAKALKERDAFTIALSGGSLPSLLASLDESFQQKKVEPHYNKWHILLADERCVPSSHDDSNLGALQKNLFSKVSVPANQIYGIDESLLGGPSSTQAIAEQYETILKQVLDQHSGGKLDVAVLGFGPDGHTCSLFPEHALLQEDKKWVAPITDSPKPPANRITLTIPVLNVHTRCAVFCGAGSSKLPIIQAIWKTQVSATSSNVFTTEMIDPAPYPCAMIRPENDETQDSSLIWVVDKDAALESS